MANSVDPDEMPYSVASHLGLHCLLRPVCPNTYGKYGTYQFDNNNVQADLGIDWLLVKLDHTAKVVYSTVDSSLERLYAIVFAHTT